MKKTQIIAILIAVIAILWVGSGVLLSGPPEEDHHKISDDNQQREQTAPQVRVKDLQAETFTADLILTGRTRAESKIDIRAEVSGILTELKANKGDRVEAGTSLGKIEIKERAARVEEARQLLNQRSTEYNAAKTLHTKGFSSDINLATKRAAMEAAQSAFVQAKNTLDKTRLIAPIDGIINARPLDTGDLVNIGDSVFTLVDLDPIHITGYVAEKDIADISTGSIAEAEFLDGTTISGPITFIAAASDEQTRTFQIEMIADNKDLMVQDGLTARLRVPLTPRKAHKISPSILSLNEAGNVGVKTVSADNKVAFVPVEIVADKSEFMWIEGLPEKARLITVGQEFVQDGQSVTPVLSEGDGLL